MGVAYNSRIVTDGLVLALDAGNTKSYDKYENFLTYSQDFNAWTNANLSITANNDVAPDGTPTAERVSNTPNAGSYLVKSTILELNTNYTLSLYVKVISGNGIIAFEFTRITYNGFDTCIFDLNSLSASGTLSSNVSMTSVGNGWYRISIKFTTPSVNFAGGPPYLSTIYFGAYGSVATTNTFAIWGAQLERSTSATDYYATTTTAKTRGTSWINLAGVGNTGTLYLSPFYNNSNGGYISFNGVNNYASCGALSGSFASFTVITWFYPNSVSNYQNPIDCNYSYNGNTGNVGPRLEMNSSGTLAWNYSNDTAVNNNFYSHTVVSSGLVASKWHCAAITYNGGTNTSTTYYNGNSTGISRTLVGTPTGFVGVMNNVFLGKGFHLGGAERLFNGRIAQTQIYNRALTAAEIQQNFNTSRGRFGI
jgi:hypothetical protein